MNNFKKRHLRILFTSTEILQSISVLNVQDSFFASKQSILSQSESGSSTLQGMEHLVLGKL